MTEGFHRLDAVWVEAPEEDDDDDLERSLTFRLRDQFAVVDRDQLVLPITVLERNGEALEEPKPAMLMQYGGEGLLNDLILEADYQPEAGMKFLLTHAEGFGRDLTLLTDDD